MTTAQLIAAVLNTLYGTMGGSLVGVPYLPPSAGALGQKTMRRGSPLESEVKIGAPPHLATSIFFLGGGPLGHVHLL